MNHVFEESVLWDSVFFRKTENEPWYLETGANNVALEFLDERNWMSAPKSIAVYLRRNRTTFLSAAEKSR